MTVSVLGINKKNSCYDNKERIIKILMTYLLRVSGISIPRNNSEY